MQHREERWDAVEPETTEISWAAPWFVRPENMKGADGALPPLFSPHPDSNPSKGEAFSKKKKKLKKK